MIVFATAAALLPNRYTLLPAGVGPGISTAFYVLVGFTWLAHSVPKIRHLERPSALALTALMTLVAALYFATIIGRIATGGSSLQGGPLLEAAILVWILTVLNL
jgi:amino acid transporter